MSHEYVKHALALARLSTDFCVFDLETTDKLLEVHTPDAVKAARSPHAVGSLSGKVMQIAARRYRWDPRTERVTLLGEMNVLINDPDVLPCCLNEMAFKTHNISIAKCRAQGVAPQIAWAKLLKLADGALLMGHNIIDFDIPFANREIARAGLRRQLDLQLAIDTLLIARHVWWGGLSSFRLRELANFLGVKTDPKLDHDALGDIDTTWQNWMAMRPGLRTYYARFIAGQPDQYKRALGNVGSAWRQAG